MNFFEQCHKHALLNPESKAIVSNSVVLNYAQMLERVKIGAALLAEEGIDENATVGLTVPNEVEHLIITLSLFYVGARQIILPSHSTFKMNEMLADRVHVTHVLTDNPINSAPVKRVLMSGGMKNTVRPNALKLMNKKEGIIFLQTSGTTARPNVLEFSEHQKSRTRKFGQSDK